MTTPKEFTMQQLLAEYGLASEIMNSTLTKAIAAELRRKGYRRERRHRVWIWTKAKPEETVEAVVQRVTKDL